MEVVKKEKRKRREMGVVWGKEEEHGERPQCLPSMLKHRQPTFLQWQKRMSIEITVGSRHVISHRFNHCYSKNVEGESLNTDLEEFGI